MGDSNKTDKDLEVRRDNAKGFYISGNVKWITEVLVIIFAVGMGWATLAAQQNTNKAELTRQYTVIRELINDRRDHESRLVILEQKAESTKETLVEMKDMLKEIIRKVDK